MGKYPKQRLIKALQEPGGGAYKFAVLACTITGRPSREVRIVNKEAFPALAEYLEKQFDDGLIDVKEAKVHITDWTFADDLGSIDFKSWLSPGPKKKFNCAHCEDGGKLARYGDKSKGEPPIVKSFCTCEKGKEAENG